MTTTTIERSTPEDLQIEIGYSEDQAAAEIGLVLDKEKHWIIPDGDWVINLRRFVRMDNLFVYKHLQTGNFVLAGWIRKPLVAIEMKCWKGDRVEDGAPAYEWVKMNLTPVDERIRRRISRYQEDRSERLQGEHESSLLQQSVVDHYQKKGDMASARAASFSRFTSAREDKEGLDETTQALIEAADACKTRVSMSGS